MNRTYELMFIVRPDMAEEDQDKLISTLESAVTSTGGQVKNVERMGKRRLAYTVRRFHDGIYVLLTVEGSGGLIHELERRLRVMDSTALALCMENGMPLNVFNMDDDTSLARIISGVRVGTLVSTSTGESDGR